MTTKKTMQELHREKYPHCTYGDKPHFVPPSMGQIGFYLCEVPTDLTNHTRRQQPFDHAEVVEAALLRYETDAEFHAQAYRAVRIAEPVMDRYEPIDLRSALVGAIVALHLADQS